MQQQPVRKLCCRPTWRAVGEGGGGGGGGGAVIMETTANGEICALPNQTPYLTNAHIIIRCSRHKKNGANNMCGHL